jgi:hypothetical protein
MPTRSCRSSIGPIERPIDRFFLSRALSHDLSSREGDIRKTRPIHLLTFVYSTVAAKFLPVVERTNGLCSALEAKLKAVEHFAGSTRESFAKVPRPGGDGEDQASFADGVVFIAQLEAYIGAVYSSLELTNAVVRNIHPKASIKHGFRAMTKKGFNTFQFDRWPWLSSFYDVRTELCHFGSPLPWIDGEAIVLSITQSHETHRFKRGTRVTIPVSEMLQYRDLMGMLDDWAMSELREVDPQLEMFQLVFDSEGRREGERPTLREMMGTHL